jgi:plastocyanin
MVLTGLGTACGSDGDSAATATSSTTAPLSTTSTEATTTTAAPTTTTAQAPTAATRMVTTTTAKATATAVAIKGFTFQPNPLRVAVGTTLRWTNEDEILHTVTSGMRTYDEQHLQKDIVPSGPGFDFQLDGKGTTATFTFSQAGTFNYLCSRHPGMDAQIVVG